MEDAIKNIIPPEKIIKKEVKVEIKSREKGSSPENTDEEEKDVEEEDNRKIVPVPQVSSNKSPYMGFPSP